MFDYWQFFNFPSGAFEISKITENNYILDIILNGYKIPFITTPESVILDNNLSARNDQIFVEKEIQSLLRKGSISVCDSIPKVVNPLTVAYGRSNKPRLVLDCRSLNSRGVARGWIMCNLDGEHWKCEAELGGSGGMLPRKKIDMWVQNGAFWMS